MKAKSKSQPDLGQEIIQASADAMWAIAQTGKGIFDSYFGSTQSEAKPLSAVHRRTHAPKVAAKKSRTARRKKK